MFNKHLLIPFHQVAASGGPENQSWPPPQEQAFWYVKSTITPPLHILFLRLNWLHSFNLSSQDSQSSVVPSLNPFQFVFLFYKGRPPGWDRVYSWGDLTCPAWRETMIPSDLATMLLLAKPTIVLALFAVASHLLLLVQLVLSCAPGLFYMFVCQAKFPLYVFGLNAEVCICLQQNSNLLLPAKLSNLSRSLWIVSLSSKVLTIPPSVVSPSDLIQIPFSPSSELLTIGASYGATSLTLQQLHCLPIHSWVQFKVLVLSSKALYCYYS